MKTTKKPSRDSRRAAPPCSAELYIQHERFCADRWKVMFRIGDETYSIGAECQLRDYAERLEHDFREALAKIGCILPNAGIERPQKPQEGRLIGQPIAGAAFGVRSDALLGGNGGEL